MSRRGESDACFKTSNHYECRLIGCLCTCHPRGRASDWPGFPSAGGCGMIVTQPTDDAA